MVAINKILLPECTSEGCGGEIGTCTDRRVHRRNAEDRVPTTRNRRQAQPLVNNLYQGMTLDAVTGLYDERNRDYSPSLGRWMEQDPAQYINGANTYQMDLGGPEGAVDPAGTDEISVSYNLTPDWLKAVATDLEKIREIDNEIGGVEKYIPGVTGFFELKRSAFDVEATIKGSADAEHGTLCSASLELDLEVANIGLKFGLQGSADLITGRVGLSFDGSLNVEIRASYSPAKKWD